MTGSRNRGIGKWKLSIKSHLVICLAGIAAVLGSCFPEIDTVKMEPLETITAVNSIYSTQTYYKIEEKEIRMVVFNGLGDWDLGFETGDQGWHIIINYSADARIIGTGISDFDAVDINTAVDLLPTNSDRWRFDHPNGNLDSTAIGNWVDSNVVYILYRGIAFNNEEAYYKIKFKSFDTDQYILTYSDLNTDVLNEKTIQKNKETSFVHYSFRVNDVNLIDPGKDEWDLLFTPYSGYFRTASEDVPYTLRGVYINYLNGVEVIKIDNPALPYDSIDYSHISEYEASSLQDAIGYDWKLIPSTENPIYYMDENIKFIIHARNGNYYKFRFVSFYNELNEKGYPIFQYNLL